MWPMGSCDVNMHARLGIYQLHKMIHKNLGGSPEHSAPSQSACKQRQLVLSLPLLVGGVGASRSPHGAGSFLEGCTDVKLHVGTAKLSATLQSEINLQCYNHARTAYHQQYPVTKVAEDKKSLSPPGGTYRTTARYSTAHPHYHRNSRRGRLLRMLCLRSTATRQRACQPGRSNFAGSSRSGAHSSGSLRI